MRWFQTLRSFHENPEVNKFAQTPAGRILIWLSASALLVWHNVSLLAAPANVSLLAPLVIGLVLIAPPQRRLILSLASAGIIIHHYIKRQQVAITLSSLASLLDTPGSWIKVAVYSIVILLSLYLVFQIAKQLPRFPDFIKRQPLILLHATICIGFALMIAVPALVAISELIPWLTWRISYLLQQGVRGGVKTTKFSDHLFYLWPTIGSSGLPYGKGLVYLSNHEAKDDISFTSAQLSGLKLLFLATLWEIVLQTFGALAYDNRINEGYSFIHWNFGLPTLAQAIVAGNTPLVISWISTFLEFIHIVVRYAIIGHVIVGFLRLCGFNIFRNTYKPLYSESIIEFWGRFNYYFKELMVDLFFYPTFLSLRQVHPQVRLCLAVFAAAFIGNMYYHILRTPLIIAVGNFQELWEVWGERLIYCALLTIGISLSMLRQQAVRKKAISKSRFVRLRAIAGVWLFYTLIHIWNLGGDELTLTNRFEFCLALLGL